MNKRESLRVTKNEVYGDQPSYPIRDFFLQINREDLLDQDRPQIHLAFRHGLVEPDSIDDKRCDALVGAKTGCPANLIERVEVVRPGPCQYTDPDNENLKLPPHIVVRFWLKTHLFYRWIFGSETDNGDPIVGTPPHIDSPPLKPDVVLPERIFP